MSIRRNMVAYVALFVALGGTSYAATQLPPGSVGTRQLRNGAVTNAKVRKGSLTMQLFVPGTLPKRLKTNTVEAATNAPLCSSPCSPGHGTDEPGTYGTVSAKCGAGHHVVGGGYSIEPQPEGGVWRTDVIPVESVPLPNAGGWKVTFVLTQKGYFPEGKVYAICASTR